MTHTAQHAPRIIPKTFSAQARQRLEAYAAALNANGITARTPIRTIAILTSDLPGEVIEAAMTNEHGESFMQRCRPHNAIHPDATRIHGLTANDLTTSPPLTDFIERLRARLHAPTQNGEPPRLICWAGQFTQDAFHASLGQPLGAEMLDLQQLIAQADKTLGTHKSFLPALASMRFTVPIEPPNRTNARQTSLTTWNVIQHILTGRHSDETTKLW